MPSPRVIAVTSIVLGLVGLTGCTSTVTGRGTAIRAFTSPPSTPVPSATVPSSSPAGGTGTPALPPASCRPGSGCHQQLSASLSAPYTVAVWTNPDAGAGGTTVVELVSDSVAVSWQSLTGQTPAQLSCITSAHSNCVLAGVTGAHGSIATVWSLMNGNLVGGAQVIGATPTMQAADLDQDGIVDVAALQNDYQPNYAAGRLYWQTWRSDGTQLTSTGCTAPSHTQIAAPTQLLTGNCP